MKLVDLKKQPDLIQQLARWHHDEWQHINPGQSLQNRIDNMQDYLSDSFVPSTYVAIDNELLGSAAIIENDMDTQSELTPWLASVYVAPEHRYKGIGKALVTHMMDEARKQCIEKLYLFTESHTEYYEKLGWLYMEQTNYRGLDVQIMVVNLKD